jgi:hypothetical protein
VSTALNHFSLGIKRLEVILSASYIPPPNPAASFSNAPTS